VAESLCEDLVDLVAQGRATWLCEEPGPSHIGGAGIVHAGTGDHSLDQRIAWSCRTRGVLCLTAPGVGSAHLPATAAVNGLEVAVSGPPDQAQETASAIAAVVAAGTVDLRAHTPAGGRVTLVGGGPGADDLITVRGMLALRAADVVVVDRLAPTGLLDALAPDVLVIDVGKTPGHHPVPQEQINQILIEQAQLGRHTVRLKGGDSYVLGRGAEEVLACREAGVPVEVVPGVTSAFAAPSLAGIPVTHRAVSTAVHVSSGHDGLQEHVLAGLRDRALTAVILMGVARLDSLVGQALAAGVDPDTPVAIIESGSTPRQRTVRTVLRDASGSAVCAPATIVIGELAGYDLSGPP
jgi:uroporphyrin-III C-methyltransferase/precorrin-2 dehydrogenase/sirohydrochlorin ferrochelatase